MALRRKKVPGDPAWKIEIRERLKPVDFTIVRPKDPTWVQQWHPRWVLNSSRRLAEMYSRCGYVPVTTDEVETPHALGDRTTSHVIHGDLILCKMPKDRYEQMRATDELFQKSLLTDQWEDIQEQAENLGIKVSQSLKQGAARPPVGLGSEDDEDEVPI